MSPDLHDIAYVCQRCRHLPTSCTLSFTGRGVWSLVVRPFPPPPAG
jgi:hypothetical protein